MFYRADRFSCPRRPRIVERTVVLKSRQHPTKLTSVFAPLPPRDKVEIGFGRPTKTSCPLELVRPKLYLGVVGGDAEVKLCGKW